LVQVDQSEETYSTQVAAYFTEYIDCFKVYRNNVSDQALKYMYGLLESEKGQANLERMEENQETMPYHQYHHFLSNSPWSAQEVKKKVSQDSSALMSIQQEQSGKPTGLLIDESSHLKKGKHSVGVARQYAGVIGKVDNCQVGVYASLCNGKHSTLIGEALFLPTEWTEDKERCLKAGIPQEAITHKTKPELALNLIDTALSNGVEFDWVGGDGLYGHNSELRKGLDNRDLLYVLDIHKDQKIYREEPIIYFPKKKAGPGRPPIHYKTDATAIKIETYVQGLEEAVWEKCKIRQTTKGWLYALIHCQTVWIWDGIEQQARKFTIIVRKTLNNQGEPIDVKYSLSNGSLNDYTVTEFAYFQAQRYWIERNFDDGKNELGLSDYQVRKWNAWHHHQAIVMMAMLFMLKEQIEQQGKYPLTSLKDTRKMVVALIIQSLEPPQKAAVREVKKREKRHLKRKKAIDWFYQKQKF